MFETLTERLGGILDRLKRRAALSEADVGEALHEVRVALIEADVALPVVKDFIEAVRVKAIGEAVLRSVTPAQMVIKIVHDHLVETLGPTVDIELKAEPPAAILLVGLQGSGKTTTAAKLAFRLKERDRKKVLLAALDVYRPAAQEQLSTLGAQAGVPVINAVFGERPVAIAKRAMDAARRDGVDVVILDSAGRTHLDDAMMDEIQQIRDATRPAETLLVADSMTGQDAVNIAKAFHELVTLTGIVLTRADGDGRGGAALSMRAVTGRPIKLLGTGEKLDALEAFQGDRIAGRILGQGDIVGLVEKAAQVVEKEDAERLARKMAKGEFTLDDMVDQLRQLKKMGSLSGLIDMLPGIGGLKQQIAKTKIDDKQVARQEAIILSMTPAERRSPNKILNGSRRRRIAAGSGTTVPEVNRLLKQFQQMEAMMKQASRLGGKGMARVGLGGLLRRG